MIALFSFFVILILSLTIVRIAAVMLQMTGISMDAAKFQARSAFTGTGFTTRESEMILTHPLRRKIVLALMLIGNLGFVTFVSSLVISFLKAESSLELVKNGAVLIGGLGMLYLISRSKMIDRMLSRIISRLLKRWTKLHARDYDGLLNLSGDYEVIRTSVEAGSWYAERSLLELKLSDEGVLILGIHRRDGYFLGSPRGETLLYPGDELILYGREERIRSLSSRRAGAKGDGEHREAVRDQRKMEGKRSESKEMKGEEEKHEGWPSALFRRRGKKR